VLSLGATSALGGSPGAGVIAFERTVGTNSDIYTIAPDGKTLRRLTDWARADFAPSWNSAGRIVFASDRSGSFELFTMTAVGGSQRQLTKGALPPNKSGPDWAPGGKQVAFTAGTPRRAEVYVLTLAGARLTNVSRNVAADDTNPDWSPDGTQLVFSSSRGRRHLYRYDVASRRLVRLTRGSGSDFDPAWSPDGARIAFTRRDATGNYDVYVLELAIGQERRLTSGFGQDRDPTWSPDGTAIAFVTNRDSADDYEIYTMNADGSNPVNVTHSPRTIDQSPDWSGASVRAPEAAGGPRALQIAAASCNAPKGTSGNDTLVGNDSGQVLCGKAGNDTIRAAGGNDSVRGGPGNDAIWGGRGSDLIQGGGGKNRLYGGRGADTFYANGGKDVIDGGPGNTDRCEFCEPSDSVVGVEVVRGG
jgi:dipeptidyl aminopeptidase/acylaminoacyl peptidase